MNSEKPTVINMQHGRINITNTEIILFTEVENMWCLAFQMFAMKPICILRESGVFKQGSAFKNVLFAYVLKPEEIVNVNN